MILYPAIDLKDGQCVRLLHGDMDKATVFNNSPADQAAQFQDEGFQYLHVVDLNGAIEGKAVNGEAVRAILKNTANPVQLGGGIRTLANVEAWLEAGPAIGSATTVNPGKGPVNGTFAGLDADGALLLDTAAGRQRILAGDVLFGDA